MDHELKSATRSHFSRLGLMYFIGSLIIYGVQVVISLIVSSTKPDLLENINYTLLIMMLPTYCIAMPLTIFLICKFVPAKQIEKKKMTVGQWIVAFIISMAGMYLSNIIGLILTQVIGIIKGTPVSNAMVDISTSTNLWLNLVIMVLLAPVFEEIIFRKLIVDSTVKYGEGTAVLISGLMFGLFHGNLNQFAYAFVLGVIFAFVYVKTGTIRYTIFLHMAVNFIGSVLSVWVIGLIDLDALEMASGDPEYMMEFMTTHLPQFAAYMLYMFALFGLVIAGIILFFVNKKKVHLTPGEISIPKGSRFSTAVINVGMILYSIFWIAMIIIQILQ